MKAVDAYRIALENEQQIVKQVIDTLANNGKYWADFEFISPELKSSLNSDGYTIREDNGNYRIFWR